MDFIRKPEVLATANAVGTASIYFILSKRLNALTDEVDEIDNHLSSSIKKISDNSRSIQGVTEAFKEVLTKFEEHRKNINNFTRTFKKVDDEINDLNDKYDAIISAIKDLGGSVDLRKAKKKNKKNKEDKKSDSSSDSESERDKKSKSKDSERERGSRSESRPTISVDRKKETKEEDNSDEDFVKKASAFSKK